MHLPIIFVPLGCNGKILRLAGTGIGCTAPDVDEGDGDNESEDPSNDCAGV